MPLDETGRAQARELAERAAAHGFATMWSSTLLRARETAEIVAAKLGLEPIYDERFVETDAGDWTDRPFSEVQAESPSCSPSSSLETHRSRSRAASRSRSRRSAWSAALDNVEAGPLPALVVCHGMVIRAALSVRAGEWLPNGQRVQNGALVPLNPAVAEADTGNGRCHGGELRLHKGQK